MEHTIPVHVDRVWWIAQVAKAMRYVERASGEAVRFLHRGAMNHAEAAGMADHVNIGFDDLGNTDRVIGQQSKWNGVKSIAFDPSVKWAKNWFQRFILGRDDLYTIAVHELGHLLGLPHNESLGERSVMESNPVFAEFSLTEIAQLKRLSVLAVAMMVSGCVGYTVAPSLSFANEKGQSITAGVVIIKPDKHSNK